jgi:DNA invertase Pin-like site-specific DNA recombinase
MQQTGELVGYARVSTEDQNLDMQVRALLAAGVHPDRIFKEHVSGASKNRPELDLALMELRPGDTLVVWRIDRLARTSKELFRRLETIAANGAGFKSLTENFDFSSSMGKFVLGILGLVAEFERHITIERTKAGLAAARARGLKLGTAPVLTPEKQQKARAMLKEGMRQIDIARKLKVSLSTLQNWHHKRGAYAPKNGKNGNGHKPGKK